MSYAGGSFEGVSQTFQLAANSLYLSLF